MSLIAWIERWWFGLSRPVLALLVLGLVVLRSGIWLIPNMELSRLIAQAPTRNPFAGDPASYLMWNWLGPAVAWSLGALSPKAFFAVHLAASTAFFAVVVWMLMRHLSDHAFRVALLVFAMLPVSGTAFFWVGYDSFTLLLMACILLCARRPWLAGAVAALLGMQHFEQGVFALGVLGVSFVALRLWGDPNAAAQRFPWWSIVAVALGLVLGRLILAALFQQWGVQAVGRGDWVAVHGKRNLANFLLHVHFVLWATLGVAWLAIARLGLERDGRMPVMLGLAAALPLILLADDQTRIFGIVTLWLLMVHWMLNERLLMTVSRQQASIGVLALVVVPWFWSWGGLQQGSATPYGVAWLVNKVFGWPGMPDRLVTWPFTCSWC